MALAIEAQMPEIRFYSVASDAHRRRRATQLHNYRVALRRTKSLIVAGQRVFPPFLADSAIRAVSSELRATAGVRNLDVLAESLKSWADGLSPELHVGLRAIVDVTEERRRLGYEAVAAMIASDAHREMIADLRTLGTVYRLGGEEAGEDVLIRSKVVATSAFDDAWARVEEASEIAMASGEISDWHRLRRRLRRVRYLTDAFGPVIGDDLSTQRAKQVGKLLRELGELQDMVVEAELLEKFGRKLGAEAAMAAGAMINPIQLEIPQQVRRVRKRWKKLHRLTIT